MVGGRLRCLGSCQHLKNRFAMGFQLDVTTTTPSEEEIAACAQRLGDAGLDCVLDRAAHILDEEKHVALLAFLGVGAQQEGAASSSPSPSGLRGVVLRERQGRHVRFEMPPQAGMPLPQIFGTIERNREAVGIASYALSQTSLEQIFNGFAAQQEEETGAAAGIVR